MGYQTDYKKELDELGRIMDPFNPTTKSIDRASFDALIIIGRILDDMLKQPNGYNKI